MFKALTVVKNVPSWVWIAGAAGVAFYLIKKGGIQGAAAGVTAGAVGAAADVVSGAAVGVTQGVGDILGIPRTDETKCQAAMRAGDNWGASKYCDAGTFIRWQLSGFKSDINKALSQF